MTCSVCGRTSATRRENRRKTGQRNVNLVHTFLWHFVEVSNDGGWLGGSGGGGGRFFAYCAVFCVLCIFDISLQLLEIHNLTLIPRLFSHFICRWCKMQADDHRTNLKIPLSLSLSLSYCFARSLVRSFFDIHTQTQHFMGHNVQSLHFWFNVRPHRLQDSARLFTDSHECGYGESGTEW